ncbi:MAG: DNA primase [Acidobacteria bacterium RIFCSPLOWO2_12_FULL_54_10]|nr:MAG: DNA primase [Acidobacteria bacterium RIFCSPLOWO2_12_FULL_54_10]
MAFPSDFAQHVKSSVDIARVIGESVRLKKTGNNYTGLCPFHQEKTPSFSVHATRQFYYCFGCGAKGDVFRFVMETEKVPFPQAVERVAQRAGIPIPARVPSPDFETPESRLRAALEKVHEQALRFFQNQLQSSEAAPLRELIKKRGVTQESVAEFGLGYAPVSGSALIGHLRREGVPREILEPSGLFVVRDNGDLVDRFRGRWIFPITAASGKVIAFAGRALGSDHPKYLNSPETPLYSKSRVLYNLSRARDAIRAAGRALLVEGYMDVIAVWQAGNKNVVASCGTALTEAQVRLLTKYCTAIVVNYDPDSAGVAAADRSLALLLEESMDVKVLRLPGGLDPDRFIVERGAKAYAECLDRAQPFFRYLADRAIEIHGSATPEAKLASLNFILPYVTKLPDKLIRSELSADIAQKLGVNSQLVAESFRKAAVERKDSIAAPKSAGHLPAAEAMLIRLLLDDAEARQEIADALLSKGLIEELESRSIVETILSMMSLDSQIDVITVTEQLLEPHQKTLANILFDKDARPVSKSEISAYISALERKHLENRRISLRQRLQDAQRSQQADLVVNLLKEKNELDKMLVELLQRKDS